MCLYNRKYSQKESSRTQKSKLQDKICVPDSLKKKKKEEGDSH